MNLFHHTDNLDILDSSGCGEICFLVYFSIGSYTIYTRYFFFFLDTSISNPIQVSISLILSQLSRSKLKQVCLLHLMVCKHFPVASTLRQNFHNTQVLDVKLRWSQTFHAYVSGKINASVSRYGTLLRIIFYSRNFFFTQKDISRMALLQEYIKPNCHPTAARLRNQLGRPVAQGPLNTFGEPCAVDGAQCMGGTGQQPSGLAGLGE